MRNLLHSARALVSDLASTLLFLVVLLVTGNLILAVVLGMALGLLQIAVQVARRKPIDSMQWLSLFLIVGSGTATLLTTDARFVMLKPSIIYVIVGVVMLRPGWMNRYLPPIAVETVPDLAFIFGYVWAALMFLSAALNIALALSLDPATWAIAKSIWAIGSKVVLFLIQFAVMKGIGVRRVRARMTRAASAPT